MEIIKRGTKTLPEDKIYIGKCHTCGCKFTYNEWENCLSFNDDILPLIEKMKELQGSDSNKI